MKKLLHFGIIFMFLFVIRVYAMEKPSVPAESDLIGMCYYEYNSNKLELYVKKDYSMIVIGDELEYYDYGYASSGASVTISYDSFMGSNSFNCNNVSNVYVNKVHSGSNYEYTDYYVDLNATDHTTTDRSGANFPHEYQVNIDKSKVYEINQDSNLVDNGEWIAICHYGSSYLKIGRSNFETNVEYYNQNDTLKEKLMSLLSNNSYSCPVSLCHENLYDVSWSSFEYQYKPKCITSTTYSSEWNCGLLSTHMRTYDSLKTNSANNGELDKTIDTIKEFCLSIYKNQSYDDPTECVKECLEIDEIFEKDMGFNKNGSCGFSERLILWIANIIRWVKYIVPVAVIVLGILDFMKAISADKDDEMKKAQQRFIRRLIAAALIFIAPFIIEFILNKLGFAANGCGIINL